MISIEELETLLAKIPGVNVKLPPHLHPPFRSKPIIVARGYENFDRQSLIDPVIGYECPAGHRAVLNLLALGVNYQDKLTTWTDETYALSAWKNNQPYDLINPWGSLPEVGYDPLSDTLNILVNEASDPTAGAGAVVSGLNDNPFGLTNMIPILVQLDGGDVFKIVYDGRAGASDEGHNLYAKLAGWIWARQEEAEGDTGR